MNIKSASFVAKLESLRPLAAADLQRLNRSVVVKSEPAEPEMYLCKKCQTEWPRTGEFFYLTSDGRYNSPCRACILEQKQEMHAVTPCTVEGCNNPRHRSTSGKYTSYCSDHLWHKRQKEKAIR